ncbi:MAG TPA: prolyl oligopeptidase family serine peptidase [Candidatus Eisenbacteria bacterium]|nr:prolyl oligopeptidase family serine peptidase [Candidatus Eisenbacteria bacterium]
MHFRHVRWIAAVSTLCMISGAAHGAQEKQELANTSPWKPEDAIYAERLGDFRISPDGQWVAWTKNFGDKEKDAIAADLYLTNLKDRTEIQLTRGNDDASGIRWSPDGKWIAFLSNRARPDAKPDTAKTQIWLINPHGGEPYALTELLRAPEQVDWLDGETLMYSAEEDPSAYEQAQNKRKDNSEVADDAAHKPPVRLFKINIRDKKITRLTTNTDWIHDWSVSKDGKYVVAVHAKSLHYTFDQKVPPVTMLHNLTDGTEKAMFTEGRVRPLGFAWTPDSTGFYAAAPYSTDSRFLTASIVLVYFYDVASGKNVQVPLDWENGMGSDLTATSDGFLAGLAAGYRFETAGYTRSKNGDGWSWKRASLEGETAANIMKFDATRDGKTIVYEYSTSTKMPQLYTAQVDGDKLVAATQLTHLNEELVKSREFPNVEVIHWKGSNGDEVEGLLHYPAKYQAGKKYPVITAIHGGPTGSDKDFWYNNWAYPLQLLTQRGAFVLQVNYHGSNNYGLKWVESICCGKYYDLETPDINDGVDYLIGKGLVDPDKVATMGWSNGSILSTSLLVTYPDRYKVASVGAGDVEWISDWGNVIFGDSFDSYYFGKSPLEDPGLYVRKSPFFRLDKVKAPVLIFQGTADTNVPPDQSWSYFRALQYYGKVPVKFVIFPGEPHGPHKLTHQMRKVEEEMAWFDRYFFKSTREANEALKEGSPLEEALRTKNIARTAGVWGSSYASRGKPVLIPEVVKRGEVEVGRFEVTRAQFAAFDKNYKFVAGTENYPANGVTFEQAKAYADWLSKLTGENWRLPNETEAAGWYSKRDSENTLDYWAGYAPNPDDTKRLQQAMKELGGDAPLLKPAGSFAGQGMEDQELIFDLGGNAAEWVVTADQSGKTEGGSADCPADTRSSCVAASEYVGFRVVRGAATK